MRKHNRDVTDNEILEKIGLSDLTEVAKLDKKVFFQKINVAKKDTVKFYNKAIKENPEEKKAIRDVKKAWIKAFNRFRMDNQPPRLENRLRLKEIETKRVNLFFALRKDLDYLDKIFDEDYTDEQILEICRDLALKYELDDNDYFLKQNKLSPKKYSRRYLYAIRSWTGHFVEFLYCPIGFEPETFEDLLLKNGIFLETDEERKENSKSNFVRRKNKTIDVFISGILVVLAAGFYILGGVVGFDWLTNIFFSIATSFLVTFLIDLISKAKRIYFAKRAEKFNKTLIIIRKTKSDIEKYYKAFKDASKLEDLGVAFLDYCLEIKELLEKIKSVKEIVCLDGEPFTTNYMALTRFYDSNMEQMHTVITGTYFYMQEKERLKMLDDNQKACAEIVDSTYSVVIDLLDSVMFGVTDDNFIEKIFNEKINGTNSKK